jgi:hypothetical protein
MNRSALSDPLFIGPFKRSPMKKESTPKNARRSLKKTSNEKEATLKKARSSLKRPPMKKEATQKMQGAH